MLRFWHRPDEFRRAQSQGLRFDRWPPLRSGPTDRRGGPECQAVTRLEYATWKLGRVVDCTGLENRQTERFLGFESLSFRQIQPARNFVGKRFLPMNTMCQASLAMTHSAGSLGLGGWPLPMRLSCPVYQLISRIPILSMALMPVVIGLTWYTGSLPSSSLLGLTVLEPWCLVEKWFDYLTMKKE